VSVCVSLSVSMFVCGFLLSAHAVSPLFSRTSQAPMIVSAMQHAEPCARAAAMKALSGATPGCGWFIVTKKCATHATNIRSVLLGALNAVIYWSALDFIAAPFSLALRIPSGFLSHTHARRQLEPMLHLVFAAMEDGAAMVRDAAMITLAGLASGCQVHARSRFVTDLC
jgi:hypothetical protein